jgi:hypothetical protein
MDPISPHGIKRFFHIGSLLIIVAFALSGVLSLLPTSAQAAVGGEISDCSGPNNQCLTLTYQDASGNSHPLTDNNGHPLDPTAEHVTSGDIITVQGSHWDPAQPFQVWLSQPFSNMSQEPTNNECYVRIDASASPNPDGTFTRSVALPTLDYNTYPNGAYFTIEAGSRGIGCIASDRPANQSILDAENSSFEISFWAYPKPPVATCGVNSPCLTVSPGVVYPGNTVTVAGQGWSGSSVGLYIYSGTTAVCSVPVGNATISQGNFTATINAPPLPTLPPVTADAGSLPVQFQVLAVSPAPTGNTCTESGQSKSASLYVSQPTLTVSSSVHSGDTVTITGNHWAARGGSGTTSEQPVNVAIFVGADKSPFSCSQAKTYNVTSKVADPDDGTFKVTFSADSVNQDTLKHVRAIALPAGSTAATICNNLSTNTATCQQSQTASDQCPLMAAESSFKITPGPQPNWLPIIIPAALLLLLLPLFFWLGRRDETEVIVTEQDVTVERQIANANAPTQYTDASFARTIRITRSLVNLRNGKIKDQDIEEYDVFTDAQGKEVRRLRPPTK